MRRNNSNIYQNLRRANLRGADFSGAKLRGADFYSADLIEANLQWADFRGADLREADFRGANLRGADLRGANLKEANLCRASLLDTCLDPRNLCPDATEEVVKAGMLIDENGYVHGWRTATSKYCGSTDYTKPGRYTCPWFSTDTSTKCHPGLYFASKDTITDYPPPFVKTMAHISTIVAAIDKFRTKELWIIAYLESLT